MNAERMNVGVRGSIGGAIQKFGFWNLKRLQIPERLRIAQGAFSPNLTSQPSSVEEGNAASHPEGRSSSPEPQEQTPSLSNSATRAQAFQLVSPFLQEEIIPLEIPKVEVGTQTPAFEALVVEDGTQTTPLQDPTAEEGIQTYQPEFQHDLQYTDGPARIVGMRDGSKNCIALLLTEDMVAKLREITEVNRRLELVESSFEDAKGEAAIAEASMDQIKDSLDSADSHEEANRIRAEMEAMEPNLLQVCEKRDELEVHFTNLKISLESARAYSHDLFERVLEEADLLPVPEPEPEIIPSTSDMSLPRRESITSKRSGESLLSLDALYRQATMKEIEMRATELSDLYDMFDDRRARYNRERLEWADAVREGQTFMTQTQFDNCLLDSEIQTGQDLIEMEAAQDEALSRARKLGVFQYTWDQESNFADDDDDGYTLSCENDLKASCDRVFIHDWMDSIPDSRGSQDLPSENEEAQNSQELPSENEEIQDPQDLQPGFKEAQDPLNSSPELEEAGMDGTFSAIFEIRKQRKRAARWQKIMELEREEAERLRIELLGPQLPESNELPNASPRRHSI